MFTDCGSPDCESCYGSPVPKEGTKMAKGEIKISFAKDAEAMLGALSKAVERCNQLREDVELTMRILAHRHTFDDWRKYEWGPMPDLPDIDTAREVLRSIDAKLREDNKDVSEDDASVYPTKPD